MIPGPSELLIIFGVAILLFGPNKLPKLGTAIGESIRNFKKGMKPTDGSDEVPQTPSGTQPTLLTSASPTQTVNQTETQTTPKTTA